MKIDNKTKAFLFLIVFLLSIILYQYMVNKSNYEDKIKENQNKIEEIKSLHKDSIIEMKADFLQKIDSFKVQVKGLSEYSNDLTKKIKKYENRPNINIDFITASSILSESRYKLRK